MRESTFSFLSVPRRRAGAAVDVLGAALPGGAEGAAAVAPRRRPHVQVPGRAPLRTARAAQPRGATRMVGTDYR